MKNIYLNGVAIVSADTKFIGYFEELDDPYVCDNSVLVIRLINGSSVEMEA